jgi:hypothetical protein
MELTPELQNAYDEELAFLKDTNDTYLQDTLDFHLEEEGSSVKSVIQAVALLSARTQVSAKRHISLLHQRLIRQIVSYLVSPVPAMGLVQVGVTNLIEPATIPAGTNLIFTNQQEQEAQFKCLFDTPLLPIRLVNLGLVKSVGSGCELVMQLEALNQYPGQLDALKVCVFAHGNYLSAVRLKTLLADHCVQIQAVFDHDSPVDVDIDYELHDVSPTRKALHPLIRERQFFQMPHQNAYIQLHCDHSPNDWRRCNVVFRLDCDWPDSLLVGQDLFKLFVVPVENRQAAQAETIFFEGTKTDHTVQPPDNFPNLRLASVKGVYHLVDGEHIPLYSAMISDESDTYEIVYPQITNTQTDQAPHLLINMPRAFDEPVKVLLDGSWHNPSFSRATNDHIQVFPAELDINGATWEPVGMSGKKFVPFTPPAALLSNQLLELAALKNKPIMSLPELLFVINSLSTVWKGDFKVLQPLIKKLEVKRRTRNKRVDMTALNDKPVLFYILGFREFDESLLPLLTEFIKHLEAILGYWISHHRINVIADFVGANTIQAVPHVSILNSDGLVALDPESGDEI